jgi:hypothetical protein
MKLTPATSLLLCALAAGAAALPGVAGAQTRTPAKTYLVTLVAGSAAGSVVTHEALTLAGTGAASQLRIASADGSVLSVPATFTSRGEIASDSQDGAITCYNMTMNVLARLRQPASGPASAFVRFGNSIVAVPLDVRATQTRGSVHDVALDGRSSGIFTVEGAAVDAGIRITAAIEQNGDDVRSATFDEVHYLGTPAQVVARSTCALRRAEETPTAGT